MGSCCFFEIAESQGRASKLQSAVAGSSGHDVSFLEKASKFPHVPCFWGKIVVGQELKDVWEMFVF